MIIAGGSGGSRVSLLAAARHPDLAAALTVWWISGGALGLVGLGYHYCSGSIRAAWHGGMEAVVALPEWQEPLERNPGNRDRFLALDPKDFIETMERWMLVYCPCGDEVVPGLSAAGAQAMTLPTMVFRSGASDLNHTRATSEAIAADPPERPAGRAAVGRPRVERSPGGPGRRREPVRPLAPPRPPAPGVVRWPPGLTVRRG